MSTGRSVRLVATARQWYDGRLLLSGDEFVTSEAEADDLVALNFARRARVAAVLAGPPENRQARAAESPVANRRTYRRRDMRAEK